MKILYIGNRQAGFVGFMALLAKKQDISAVISRDEEIVKLANYYGIELIDSVFNTLVDDMLKRDWLDLLVNVHGREIIPENILGKFRLGGINVHPCLYAFKGSNPIKRFLESPYYPEASVGVHRMTAEIDEGEVILEEFVDVEGCRTEIEVYNRLYPYYAMVLMKALKIVEIEGTGAECTA